MIRRSARPFGAWLLDQTGRRDSIGDLARDFARTRCPHTECPGPHRCRQPRISRWDVAEVTADLDRHDACDGAYDALRRAEAEWRGTTPANTASEGDTR